MRNAEGTRFEHDNATFTPATEADAHPGGQVDAPADPAVESVEIIVSWGTTVLHIGHLTPPRPFDVGEGRLDGRPCDCFLPEHVLGARRVPLLKVDAAGRARFVLLAGATGSIAFGTEAVSAEDARRAHPLDVQGSGSPCGALRAEPQEPRCAAVEGAVELPLAAATRIDVELRGVRIQVGADVAARARTPRAFASRRTLALAFGSGALHLGFLGALALCASSPSELDDGMSVEQISLLQRYLASVDERELEQRETELAASPHDVKEGGAGTRAKGEEGSMGAAGSAFTSQRYGVSGPSDSPDPHIARQSALRDAQEFGMIGLLGSGSGGDPNAPAAPWGRHDGSEAASGAAGLGLSGVGDGGGGRGEGVGLGAIGTIGHGAGTGTDQGFGSGHGRLGGASTTMTLGDAVAYARAPEAPIDPNGRFATTYRPGGGHLAAFEAAVARGIVPADARELVSDVGARYAPDIPPVEGNALTLRPDLERAALPPSGGPFHLRLALRSSAVAPPSRPRLSVHLVLDTSGSMAGEPIAHARRAAQALVDRLAPTDDFSMTTFSSGAEVLIPDGLVGARRAAIRRVIADLREGGGTNIGEGLSLAYQQARLPSIPYDAVRVVLLISDGRATSGVTSSERLSRLALDAFQHGIQTSAFGLGSDYDGQLMSSVAADGAGGYYYLRDPEQIASALSTELDQRIDPVATAVEVRIRLSKGVDLLRVYGSRRLNDVEASRVRAQEVAADLQASERDKIKTDRQDDVEGGLRFFMPAFARDDRHALLLKLRVGAEVQRRNVATVELKYKDRLSQENVTEEVPISVAWAESDAASATTADASVARTIQGFAAGETLAEAALRAGQGDRAGAAALLGEREGILRHAASALDEPLFLADASRLARLRVRATSEPALGDPLVLAMLLETAGRSHLH